MPKKMNKREALLNQTHTRAMGVSVSRSGDTDTLEFVFVSDDNGGTRFDWGSGEYYTEELDVNGANVERLNTFFKDHWRNVDSAVGKVHDVRVDNGQLVGKVTFGSDEDSQRVFSKYNEGILTDVSIGYEIRDYKVSVSAENERDVVTVSDFDIFEVSAVGIGFDSGAKKRSEDNFIEDRIMTEDQLQRLAELEAMSKRTKKELEELKDLEAKRDAEKKEKDDTEKRDLKAQISEMKREKEVNAIALSHGERGAKLLAGNATATPEEFRALLLDEIAKDQPNQTIMQDDNTRGKMIDAIVDGLALRVGAGALKNPHADSHLYRGASLSTIANLLLPESDRSFDANIVAERALVSGQFPLLLLSVGNRVLEAEFEAQSQTYKAWVKEVDVPDFRSNIDIVTGRGGRLDKTLENGDLKELGISESAESWALESFGNKFVLTRQMIINDDLGAFTNLIAEFGAMAMTTANGIVYDILSSKGSYSNYKMADGSAIFNTTTHKNKASVALSPASLSAGRLAMSKHKSIDGKTALNIKPKYLIVGAGLEQTAREILGATNKIDPDANTGEINVHQNSLELVVDYELNDTEWYLSAERRTIKVGYLAGTNRQPSVKMNDSTLVRTTFEGLFDLGVVAEDYRGLYQGNQ